MANTTHIDESGNPSGRMREPPEVTVKMLKMRDLPKKTTPWEDIETEFLPVDFLLLTAIECEQLSCLSFLSDIKRGYTTTLGPMYFGFNSQKEGKFKIAVIKCLMGSSGPGGSIVVVYDAVPTLKPKAVFCVGYCGSLNEEKANLGDVILSSKLITYGPVKERKDETEERGSVVTPNRLTAGLIKEAGAGWEAPLTNAEALEVTVRCDGVFLTGPKVLDNPDLLKELKKRHGQGTAIEMEGEGLYTAAYNRGIEWLVIKGVSDFADGNKSGTKSWRPFASVMAASVVFHMLNDTIVFKDWPHYKRESFAKDAEPGSSTREEVRSPPPSLGAPTTSKVKIGVPTNEELETISEKIAEWWKPLGRRLKIEEPKLIAFHKQNEEYTEKAYKMLLHWKSRDGSGATYLVLDHALCHPWVNKKDLAEEICRQ